MSRLPSLNILITAGPTQEPIDPVRFISNRSTGAMGFAIAREVIKKGHKAVIVSGPTSLRPPKGAKIFFVETARQMRQQVLSKFSNIDAVIMSAAVADYRPLKAFARKIKKIKEPLDLRLVENPDILKTLGQRKKNKILAGFALETEDLYKNAAKKLKEKNLDIIVANSLTKKRNIFGENKISVLILDRNGSKKYLRSVSKDEVAREIIFQVEKMFYKQKIWRLSQEERQRSAKPLFSGSNPEAASKFRQL